MTDSTIGGLPRAESINDDSLLVMEQQGEPKSVEAGTLMKYAARKVKGGQSDWDAAEGESGHVLNRTHRRVVKMEEISFDQEQLGAEDNDVYDLSAAAGGDFVIYKITDTAFTQEQLDGAEVYFQSGDYSGYGNVEYNAEMSAAMSELAGGVVEAYSYSTLRPSTVQDADFGSILVVPSDLVIAGFGTIKKGSYIRSNLIGKHLFNQNWKIRNVVFSPLDPAYIPPADVHLFTYTDSTGGSSYDSYEIPISVGGDPVEFQVNSRFLNHVKNYKPVSVGLRLEEAHPVHFILHFPLRDIEYTSNSYAEQVIYSCELGVLFIEFKISGNYLTIKVDNLAGKLGCITSADTVNVAEEGM